ATEVINATAAAVVYNRATSIDAQATGLSVYFPGMLAAYPSTNYASNLLIDGQSVFAPSYVDALLPAYYDFYVNQQASLAASVSTAPVAGGSFAATVTNSFDFVMVAAGNPNCTVYVGSSSQQLPCEETMQQATDYTHNPGDPTWQFSFTLPGSWPMLQGAAVSLIPDPGVLTGASSLSYVIPCNLWNANDQEFIPGYLRVVMSDVGGSTSYTITGFEEALGAKGKTRALAPGDVLALDDYVQNSDGSWGFLRSDRTITLSSSSPQLSFGAYALVSGSPLTYVVNDLTGTPRVGQVQTY
ncbi:MAG: hypothetical protein KGJ64_01755, partial [Betaproteobacteria bacterium]|nr:hypothetical protein [Betaproteobacteria bacterium]